MVSLVLCGGLPFFMVQLMTVLRPFKKIIICFLALQLAFFSPFANANASPGGWTFSGFDAVSGVVSAVKNGAKATATVAKSPVVSKIGKGILGGVIAGAAIPLAISQITGLAFDAIDWVLDPANNQIKYTPKSTVLVYSVPYSNVSNMPTPEAACRARYSSRLKTKVYVIPSTGGLTCRYADVENPADNQWYGGDEVVAKKPQSGVIPVPTVADKVYDNAKTGHSDSVAAVTAAVADLTKEGEYDTPLDLSKPEDKTCEAGYVKNSAGECVKKDEPVTCPAGSFKVGDRCITPPAPKEDESCGDCCEQLLDAISALADLQTSLNQKLLDSDEETREELLKIQDKIDLLATDLKSVNDNIVKLVDEAKKLNTTVEKLDENQELRFQKLTDTINEANQKLLDSDKITQDKLEELDDNQELRFQKLTDTINESNQKLLDSDKITQDKLDEINELLTQSLDEFKKTNEKLDKVNENLEKMQKCNETEFNKKVCDFIDWFQEEPTKPTDEKPTIKDIEAESSNKIDMSGSCPAPYQINFSVFGHSQNNSISYEPLCNALEMLKPIFIGAGALSSMFILMGYSRPNSTGVND